MGHKSALKCLYLELSPLREIVNEPALIAKSAIAIGMRPGMEAAPGGMAPGVQYCPA